MKAHTSTIPQVNEASCYEMLGRFLANLPWGTTLYKSEVIQGKGGWFYQVHHDEPEEDESPLDPEGQPDWGEDEEFGEDESDPDDEDV